MVRLSKCLIIVSVLAGVLHGVVEARAQGGVAVAPDSPQDFSGIKRELAVFQGVVDATLKQHLPGPFPLLGTTKGTYLPEYGAVFNVEVNVYQIRQLSPFDVRPLTEKELSDAYNQMLDRIKTVKGLLVKIIGDHGANLELLKPEENVTVVAHLFAAASDRKREFPSQVVFSAKKSVIEGYRERKLSLEEFVKNMQVLQY
jgi:hypothetical protein